MDGDEDEAVMTCEGNMDIRMPNNLDLNVEHNCRNPKFSNIVNGDYSAGSSKDVLKLGTEFDTDEQAYGFYSRYAELVGFTVRKDWVNRSKIHGRVMSRKFTCSRQGHRKKDKRDINVKKHRKETRTGCLAQMVVTRQPNGKYVVTQFEMEHNHADVNLSKAEKLLESPLSGKGDSAEISETDSMKNSEIQSKISLHFLGIRICPLENYDNLQVSADIFLGSGRSRDMKEGDAAQLLYYFQRQHFRNPAFFYSVHLDIEDKVSNIFWADDNMIVEYSHFGDVVCFDTSATRNLDSRPLVQFIGLNHHRQVVIFGAAFLYDDTVNSFKWLFQTFVETMSGKKPKFILSDQGATIVQAIHVVLPDTSHCICAWQMYLIALKHLHHKEHDSFATNFWSCIFIHEQEDEFIQAWNSMLEKHGLHQNSWLKWMFREKEKWAVAYSRNTFFIGKNGTHLVEQMSYKLKSYLSLDLDILQFFKHFEILVNEQRYSELEVAFEMQRQTPTLMANAVLLKHPSEIYTPKAFEVFQREYEKCLNVIIDKNGERDSRFDYKVKTYGKSRDFLVLFNSLDRTVSCNCMKFEHVGFLCSHALKVLDHHNIKVVPTCYILKRWTRDARILPVGENYCSSKEDNSSSIAARYKDLCRNIIKISARAAESDHAFEFASRQLDEVIQGIEKVLNFKSIEVANRSCPSEREPVNADHHDRNDFEGEDVNVLQRTTETGSVVPDKSPLNHFHEQIFSANGDLNTGPSLPGTVLSVACPPSSHIPSSILTSTLNPLTQVLYPLEANHAVQSIYQTSTLPINHQPSPSVYEPQTFFSNQHHSLNHSQILQSKSP